MDGDDQLREFADWFRELAARAGYDPNSRGGGAALARDAGTDRGQTSRALRGEVRPQIANLRAWTKLFNAAGVRVTLREMLVRSGTVEADDLPAPGEEPPAPPLDLQEVARSFGIPADRIPLFVSSVEAVAKTFADEAKSPMIGNSQTGGLSAKR